MGTQCSVLPTQRPSSKQSVPSHLPSKQQVGVQQVCSSSASWTAGHLRKPMRVFTHPLIQWKRGAPAVLDKPHKTLSLPPPGAQPERLLGLESPHKATEPYLHPGPGCPTWEFKPFQNNFLNFTNNCYHGSLSRALNAGRKRKANNKETVRSKAKEVER